jgi:PhoH-like ATPase
LKDEEQNLPDSFYKGKALSVDDLPKSLSGKELISNECIYFVDNDGKRLAIGNYQADERQIVYVPFKRPTTLPKLGEAIKPRNPEQACLEWHLLNPRTIFITVVARAGAGKTYLSMFAALSQLWGTNLSPCKYEKIVVFDPTCEAGDKERRLGFRTGPLDEKMAPFSAHIEEAFIQIWASVHGVHKGWEEEAEAELNRMKAAHTFEVKPISFTRGDSIRNAFIIVEETQNLRPSDVKLLVTRVARGSKIVFEGDLSQIDDPDIDFRSSGLTKAVQVFLGRKFGDEGIAGHITLIETERSALVAVANDIM